VEKQKRFAKALAAFTLVNIAGVISALIVAQHDIGAAVLLLAVFLIGGPALILDRYFYTVENS
jgi:cell division protein FtsW (lipid II flippase)